MNIQVNDITRRNLFETKSGNRYGNIFKKILINQLNIKNMYKFILISIAQGN